MRIRRKKYKIEENNNNNRNPPIKMKKLTHMVSLFQVPTTQLAKMSIDPKFVELTADVLRIIL